MSYFSLHAFVQYVSVSGTNWEKKGAWLLGRPAALTALDAVRCMHMHPYLPCILSCIAADAGSHGRGTAPADLVCRLSLF